MRMKTARVLVLMWLVLGAESVTATSVRPVNIEEMVRLSGRVFYGRCLSVEEATHGTGLPILRYTFLVTNGFKGAEDGETVVFQQLQASAVRGFWIPGLPAFRTGQDLVIFLAPESRIGLTSAVGLSQGVFAVREEQPGRVLLLNGFKNQNLGHGLEPGRLRKMGLERSHTDLLLNRGPVPLESLASMVRAIDAYQQREAAGSNQ